MNSEMHELFLDSAETTSGVMSEAEVLGWLQSRRDANTFSVEKVPLNQLTGWAFEHETGDIVHKSGRFFRVEGIEVGTNFGPTAFWEQPIINQPEIGILGFLTKKLNGILHFLVQAKMEPGNVNLIQISPSVQATKSNFTQVHGGKKPMYLEYFLDRSKGVVCLDQLQSEQGSRFLRKRNRNMIVYLSETEPLEIHEDYCWLTLHQLYSLMKFNNIVNMDSRTVLSGIQYGSSETHVNMPFSCAKESPEFSEELYVSMFCKDRYAEYPLTTLISWLTSMKTLYELQVKRKPLNCLDGWLCDGNTVRHGEGKFFSVIGVSVLASTREVVSWQQPLIESAKGGILCFICQKRKGVLHFIVQARVEPGNLDILELAPTVQCTPGNYDSDKPKSLPPFYDYITDVDDCHIRYSAIQSEEGGRFYHDQNKYIVIEIYPKEKVRLPENYIWMTMRQIKQFIQFNNYFNIEARGLISCLGLKKPKGIPG